MRTFCVLWVLAGATVGALAEEKAPEHSAGVLGCWKNTTDASMLLRFEAQRCAWFQDGKLQFARVKYEAGKVIVRIANASMVWGVELQEKDSVLWIDRKGKPSKFTRVDPAPRELQALPMELGEAKALSPEKIKELQGELKKRLEADQATRKKGRNPEEWNKVDGENTAFIIKNAQELGWLDATRFGAEASHAAFILVQHSNNLPLMLAALPLVEKDVKAKLLNGQPYALLYDRVKLMTAERQRYGTQIGKNDKGQTVVRHIEDKDKVDAFRKELGMTPLAEYLEHFKQDNGYLEIGFEEE